jgi:HEAT repeat protein/PBS lyase HEAT-like repeat-containing protein
MSGLKDTEPLAPEDTVRLIEFARACKAAARAVLLYPAAHPAIAATLGRIVHSTSADVLPQPLKMTILPDGILVDGRPPGKPDQSIVELAALLHAHLVGEIVIHPGGDLDAWRAFLLLIGRSSESVRAEGGISRAWTMLAGRHIDLREIDYTQVLRERGAKETATWDSIVKNCLEGTSFELDEDGVRDVLAIIGDTDRLAELMTTIENKAAATGDTTKAAALMRMLRDLVGVVSKNRPDELDPTLRNVASALGSLSPDGLMALIAERSSQDEEDEQLITAVVGRMPDRTIATFVARNVINDSGATDRLVQAFQTLVRDTEERERLVTMVHSEVAASTFGSTEGFETAWNGVAQKLMTSYSDKPYVSHEYARQLSLARTRAIDIEHSGDDPPERLSTWINSVATSALRALDLTLLLDLLNIEPDDRKWAALTPTVVGMLEDLLLVGDFEAASQLLAVIVRESAGDGSKGRRQAALTAIDMLVAGSMLRHVVSHLGTIDDAQFARVKEMCVSVGEVMIRPLAEALSTEEQVRRRERMTAILVAFGAVGRRTAERLKNSPNAAVRRTAILLLREFGGTEALPELTELLNDSEPRVQREAVRAIVNIGTTRAFQILGQALERGTPQSRDAIMQAASLVRDERATPLFAYMLRHIDHRKLTATYLHAVESLGTLKDPEAVEPLKEALYKGEWWAPRRTASLRSAAALALARIATPEARTVLEEAAAIGPRGTRAAARTQLSQAVSESSEEAAS